MPNYPGGGQAKLLHDNCQYYYWQGETVPAATGSVGFQLERIRATAYPFGYSVEVLFSGAPGVFQVDVQHADEDKETAYVTVVSISSVNSNNAARYELPNTWTKFTRLKIVTLTNAVAITAKASR